LHKCQWKILHFNYRWEILAKLGALKAYQFPRSGFDSHDHPNLRKTSEPDSQAPLIFMSDVENVSNLCWCKTLPVCISLCRLHIKCHEACALSNRDFFTVWRLKSKTRVQGHSLSGGLSSSCLAANLLFVHPHGRERASSLVSVQYTAYWPLPISSYSHVGVKISTYELCAIIPS
jgi:hypothetical protein